MTGHGSKLDQQQEAAIAALLTQPTVDRAAEAVGISPATMYRWLRRRRFKRAYLAARREVVEQAVARLSEAAADAAATLRRNLACGNVPAENAAARAILDWAIKGMEVLDQDVRMESMDARLRSIEDAAKKRDWRGY